MPDGGQPRSATAPAVILPRAVTDISPIALEVLEGHLSSQMRWSVIVDGVRWYRAERGNLHRTITRELLAGTTKRNHPRALVLAGGPASGKSSILASIAVPPKAVHLDPDAIKARLPEYQELQRRGDVQAAYVTHEESSDIARTVRAEVVKRRRHLILDTVGDSEPGKFADKLIELHDDGFRVDVVYVDVDVEEAVRRAAARTRVVPEKVIRALHREVAARFTEVLALDWLTSVRVFATDDGAARLIAERAAHGSLVVHDTARLELFQQKADL
jgi:predicted ABC-type ATPase